MTYPLEDVQLVLLVFHEEADLPAGPNGVGIYLQTLWVVRQIQVAHMEWLPRVHLCQNHLVPNHNLCRHDKDVRKA